MLCSFNHRYKILTQKQISEAVAFLQLLQRNRTSYFHPVFLLIFHWGLTGALPSILLTLSTITVPGVWWFHFSRWVWHLTCSISPPACLQWGACCSSCCRALVYVLHVATCTNITAWVVKGHFYSTILQSWILLQAFSRCGMAALQNITRELTEDFYANMLKYVLNIIKNAAK